MKSNTIAFSGLFGIVLSLILLSGCKKVDTEYRRYVENGETTYPGVPSSITVGGGNKRAQFKWLPSPDPSVTKYVIYWNNFADSAVMTVPAGTQSKFTGGTINLAEGTYFFTIYAFNDKNEKSIPLAANNVRVYGDLYRNGLVTRTVYQARINGNNMLLNFDPVSDKKSLFTELFYKTTTGVNTRLVVNNDSFNVTVPNCDFTSPVSCRSAFLPDDLAIDTFYSRYDTVRTVEATGSYLQNTSQPFQSVQNYNRFRDPASWTVNSTVQNHSNMGGWGTDENTVLCMESGWGSSDITNGKMYQSTMLPAGRYTMQIELGSYGYSGQVRFAAVPGTVMPDYSGGNIPNALGSADLALKSFTFTNPTNQMVTFGFLATMTGNQYWRVSKVRLLRFL